MPEGPPRRPQRRQEGDCSTQEGPGPSLSLPVIHKASQSPLLPSHLRFQSFPWRRLGLDPVPSLLASQPSKVPAPLPLSLRVRPPATWSSMRKNWPWGCLLPPQVPGSSRPVSCLGRLSAHRAELWTPRGTAEGLPWPGSPSGSCAE